jgi:hypothetical protein
MNYADWDSTWKVDCYHFCHIILNPSFLILIRQLTLYNQYIWEVSLN